MTRDVQLMFSSSNESFPNVSRFVLATQIFKTKSKLIREREKGNAQVKNSGYLWQREMVIHLGKLKRT